MHANFDKKRCDGSTQDKQGNHDHQLVEVVAERKLIKKQERDQAVG